MSQPQSPIVGNETAAATSTIIAPPLILSASLEPIHSIEGLTILSTYVTVTLPAMLGERVPPQQVTHQNVYVPELGKTMVKT